MDSKNKLARKSLRKRIARDLEMNYGWRYGAVLDAFNVMGYFDEWDEWECEHRPINLDEIDEALWDYYKDDFE